MADISYIIPRRGPQRSQFRSERMRDQLAEYALALQEMSDDELAVEAAAKQENRDALGHDLNNEYQRLTDRGKQWQLTAERVSSTLKAELSLIRREISVRNSEAKEREKAEKAETAKRIAAEREAAWARKLERRAAHERFVTESAARHAEKVRMFEQIQEEKRLARKAREDQ